MNTHQHCSKPPPTGTAGWPMPESTTASWRIRCAASPPNAGFHTRRWSYSISPGGMTPEPIALVTDLLHDDRRVTRMGVVGDGCAAGIHNVAADHQALGPTTPLSCRRRAARTPSVHSSSGIAVAIDPSAGTMVIGPTT